MKTPITILVFAAAFICALSSSATVRTVNNIPATLAQFATIQAAVDASASGDTIYVQGNAITYSGFTIANKKLLIIGPGWSPDKTAIFALPASVGGNITISGATSSNTEIQGLIFDGSGSININTAPLPSGIRFIRNRFIGNINLNLNSASVYLGYTFEGNVFENCAIIAAAAETYTDLVIRNNYFIRNNNGSAGNLTGFGNTASNVLIDHNLFNGAGNSSFQAVFAACGSLIITNNVFVKRDAAASNSFSTFNSNIVDTNGITGALIPWNVNSNHDAGGNVFGQNPQLAAIALLRAASINPLLDFTISAGPADNSSSDIPAKDMGLLFDGTGSLNWTSSRNSRFPRIFNMSITTPTIPSGGTLNVVVEGRKSN